MSREHTPSAVRCLAVWLLVSTAVLGTWSGVGGAAVSLTSTAVWHGSFDELLVAIASAALIACAGWLWVITTATVAGVVGGRTPSAAPGGLTRRLVLIACGAAVVAGVGSPSLADSPTVSASGDHSLVGLPMPDRAVVRHTAQAPVPAPAIVDRPTQRRTSEPTGHSPAITVRAGDSLWSIAAAQLGPGADVSEIDAAWRELYAANRDAIGNDADLILPGLDLEQGTASNRKAPR